ncbi:Hypothetical_protein [Hexamita inflata]|uniref:Hypothetical_protein n=1 Tax=Hexamita inflata TaxID=28002 RepID=A0AA86QYP9_9EUKA|nr:Hypothetical protein HINF_LOCUS49809 [Hexamita inflata]
MNPILQSSALKRKSINRILPRTPEERLQLIIKQTKDFPWVPLRGEAPTPNISRFQLENKSYCYQRLPIAKNFSFQVQQKRNVILNVPLEYKKDVKLKKDKKTVPMEVIDMQNKFQTQKVTIYKEIKQKTVQKVKESKMERVQTQKTNKHKIKAEIKDNIFSSYDNESTRKIKINNERENKELTVMNNTQAQQISISQLTFQRLEIFESDEIVFQLTQKCSINVCEQSVGKVSGLEIDSHENTVKIQLIDEQADELPNIIQQAHATVQISIQDLKLCNSISQLQHIQELACQPSSIKSCAQQASIQKAGQQLETPEFEVKSQISSLNDTPAQISSFTTQDLLNTIIQNPQQISIQCFNQSLLNQSHQIPHQTSSHSLKTIPQNGNGKIQIETDEEPHLLKTVLENEFHESLIRLPFISQEQSINDHLTFTNRNIPSIKCSMPLSSSEQTPVPESQLAMIENQNMLDIIQKEIQRRFNIIQETLLKCSFSNTSVLVEMFTFEKMSYSDIIRFVCNGEDPDKTVLSKKYQDDLKPEYLNIQYQLQNPQYTNVKNALIQEEKFQNLLLEVKFDNFAAELKGKFQQTREKLRLLSLDEELVKRMLEKYINIMLVRSTEVQNEYILVYNSLQNNGSNQALAECDRMIHLINEEEQFQEQTQQIYDMESMCNFYQDFLQNRKYFDSKPEHK